MVYAGKIIKDLGLEDEYTLLVTGTVQEEDCDGLCWQYIIEQSGIRPEFVVSTEPTDCQLSGGQQQRVGVARALAANPQVLLMDEPFGALDPVTREALQQEMIRIHRLLGRTIVLVTHDIDEALRLADHLVLMDDGEVVQQGQPLQMLLEPKNAFVQTFFGRSELGVRLLSLRGVSDYLRCDERLAGDALNVAMTLREALSQFIAHRCEVLPVVDERGESCGTLHFADLLREEARREGAT